MKTLATIAIGCIMTLNVMAQKGNYATRMSFLKAMYTIETIENDPTIADAETILRNTEQKIVQATNEPMTARVAAMQRIGKLYLREKSYDDGKRVFDYIMKNNGHIMEVDISSTRQMALYLSAYCFGKGEYNESMKYFLHASEDSNDMLLNYLLRIRETCINNDDKDPEKEKAAFRMLDIVTADLKERQKNTVRYYYSDEYADAMRKTACMILSMATSSMLDAFCGQYCYEKCFDITLYLRRFTFEQTNNRDNDIKHTLNVNYAKEIANALKDDEVAIEICPKKIMDGEIIYTPQYMAYIIDNNKNIEVVDVCDEEEIKTLLTTTDSATWTLYTNKKDKLKETVLKNIEPIVEGKRKIYLTPSGVLNRINFAMLDDRIAELTSSYELCRQYKTTENNSLVLVGNVLYDKETTTEKRGDRNWGETPNTKWEVDEIEKKISPILNVIKLSGPMANEDIVRAACNKAPLFLHFATHAFLFGANDIARIKNIINLNATKFELNFSGLVLNGANLTIDGKQKKNKEEDGILLSDEISHMNLNGTMMVVLSACQSALGIYDDYEGNLGLVRAFKLAGTKSIVASMWDVNDDAAAIFMIDYYNRLLNNESMRAAFMKTVEMMKGKYPDRPEFWAAFKLIDSTE